MATVVVIGRNYTSRLGMIRAVGRAGHQVYVICTSKSANSGIDKLSRYVYGYYTAKEPNRTALIETLFLIRKKETGSIVIIPVDDYAASTIDANIDVLKGNFLFPNINMEQGAINKLMDKNVQKQLAIKAGLNVAEGWTIEIQNGKYTIPADITFPCFPKPQVSFLGNKECMRKCSTEQELCQVLDKIAAVRDCPILIEQYLEIEKEYAALGFCNKDLAIIPAAIYLLEQGHGSHRGVTKIGQLIPAHEISGFFNRFQALISGSGLIGLFDVDMYESQGKIYFNELNLRFGASGYAIINIGLNLPDLMIQSLLGEQSSAIEANNAEVSPFLFVNEKVNYDDYLFGYYDWKEYKRINRLANFTFIKDDDDPRPYTKYMAQVYLQRIKNSIKKIIRRHG